MKSRVLIVDDDPELLRSVGDSLRDDFEIVAASSGAVGLQILASSAPFSVIVTDMQMPQMDGLRFIAAARKLAPEASYVMLTGDHNGQSAVAAINEGRVFRLLLKPFDMLSIRGSINAARRQFESSQADKELLNKTCAGAISLMCDLLEAQQPSLCLALQGLDTTIDAIRTAAGIAERREYALAARLALVGCASLDEDEVLRFLRGSICDTEWRKVLRRSTEIGGRMIRRMPSLKLLGAMIERCDETDGLHSSNNPTSDDAIIQVGGTLLSIGVCWQMLLAQSVDPSDAVKEMHKRFSALPTQYDTLFIDWPIDSTRTRGIEISLDEVATGMVLQKDVCTQHGDILLRCGRRMTESLIDKLRYRHETSGDLRPIFVVDTCPMAAVN